MMSMAFPGEVGPVTFQKSERATLQEPLFIWEANRFRVSYLAKETDPSKLVQLKKKFNSTRKQI